MKIENKLRLVNENYCIQLAKVLNQEMDENIRFQKKVEKRVSKFIKTMTKTEEKVNELKIIMKERPLFKEFAQARINYIEYRFDKKYEGFIKKVGSVEVVMDDGTSIMIGEIPEGEWDGQVNQQKN